jgi:hypothetical protein
MKQRSKLTQEQTQNVEQDARQESRQEAGQEFGTADELLRFDAVQTTVPPHIAERLKESIANAAPPPRRSWWHRLLGQ